MVSENDKNTADKKNLIITRELSTLYDEKMSLGYWIHRYMTEYAGGKQNSWKYKLEDIKFFYCWYKSFKGHECILDWTRFTTNAYIESLKEAILTENTSRKHKGDRKWSNRSINRKVDHLRTFAKWSLINVPLHSNPFEQIKRLYTSPLEVKSISKKDIESLKSAAYNLIGIEVRKRDRIVKKTARPQRDCALFFTLLGTGMRIREVCELNVEQFIGRRLVKVRTKGDQERTISMTDESAEMLRNYIENERPNDAKAWGDCPSLFLSIPQTHKRRKDVDGRLNVRSARDVFYKIAKRAFGKEKGKEFYPHRLRHTMGDFMNRKGGITMVAKQLGHKNIVYSAVYATYSQKDIENAMDS